MVKKRILRKTSACSVNCVCSIFKTAKKGTLFQVVLRGTSQPLRPEGTGNAVFSFTSYNPITCCVTFNYTYSSGITRLVILDCRQLSAVVYRTG